MNITRGPMEHQVTYLVNDPDTSMLTELSKAMANDGIPADAKLAIDNNGQSMTVQVSWSQILPEDVSTDDF
jgi:hypothetical protein